MVKLKKHPGPSHPSKASANYKMSIINASNKWVGSAHVSVQGKAGNGNRKKKTGRLTGGGF